MKSFLLKLSAFAFISGVVAATTVRAAELHVMSSGGFTAAYKILGPKFAAASAEVPKSSAAESARVVFQFIGFPFVLDRVEYPRSLNALQPLTV